MEEIDRERDGVGKSRRRSRQLSTIGDGRQFKDSRVHNSRRQKEPVGGTKALDRGSQHFTVKYSGGVPETSGKEVTHRSTSRPKAFAKESPSAQTSLRPSNALTTVSSAMARLNPSIFDRQVRDSRQRVDPTNTRS